MERYESWGRYPRAEQTASPVGWRHEELPTGGRSLLPRGLGRSYGDSCLNDGGVLLTTEQLSRFIAFDRERGLIRCEGGVSLDAILELGVPAGWFLPVTPGTRWVTLGGAIANDVHGKNHHVAGCFGSHVTKLELVRSGGERLVCSREENAELFAATIGGMGLTGLITWAEVQLLSVQSPFLTTENVKLRGLDEFFDVTEASARFPYTVAWIDSLASGKNLGRGLFFRGEHAPAGTKGKVPASAMRSLTVPFDFPSFVLNRLSTKAFNTLYFHKQSAALTKGVAHYAPFFYPLDAIDCWNRVYGSRGLVQYQCVVPYEASGGDRAPVVALLERVSKGAGSFLTVLKVFGDVRSPGLMSFPRPGVTLALDFPFEGERTLKLCRELDAVVKDAGGALYPAKDARMSPEMFQLSYPGWREFAAHVDPRFSSSFWRRVTGS